MEFQGIKIQAQWIARAYKWLGLYSIPVLTIVTIISISNMFSRGQLASWSWLDVIWIAVFATAIEVNIVRLFFEWKLEHDNGALWLGIGLVFVAGVALLMEGLQQSIGFAWSNQYVQIIVGFVVGLRVFVVVLLLAREGSKLASALHEDVQPLYACPVHFSDPYAAYALYACPVHFEPPMNVQDDVQENEPDLHIVHASPTVHNKRTVPPAKIRKMRTLIETNPRIPIRQLAQQAGVSQGTAQNYKNSLAKEA